MFKQQLIGTAVAFLVGASALDTQSAEFIPLGDFPAGVFHSVAQAISADGTTVVGAGSRFDSFIGSSDAFRWRQEAGVVNMQTLPLIDSPRTFAHGVSGDGDIVVGSTDYHFQPEYTVYSEPFRWTAAEGIVSLGLLSDGDGFRNGGAADVSADGHVIVGESSSSNGHSEAFRWTKESGMVGLGDLLGGGFSSTATGVSAIGTVIAGVGHSEVGLEAFRWTAETGMIGLGDLSGGFFGSIAEAVSSNGNVVVGSSYSELSEGTLEAFRWTEQHGMQPLGDLAGGYYESQAFGVSSDGSVVLGISEREDGYKAFAWDELHGMRDLQEVLIGEFALGQQLADWTLKVANDISDDGLSIVGYGTNPYGDSEGWLVRLNHPLNVPEPASAALALSAAFCACYVCRRESYRRGR